MSKRPDKRDCGDDDRLAAVDEAVLDRAAGAWRAADVAYRLNTVALLALGAIELARGHAPPVASHRLPTLGAIAPDVVALGATVLAVALLFDAGILPAVGTREEGRR
jgi:hypothetical protein